MSELNDLILGSGEDARKAVEEEDKKPKKKTNYIRLKAGESVRGFLLVNEFIAFMQHGDFNRRIHSHVCKDPRHGKDCLSCKASVPRSKVWLVPIWDVDAKEIRVFEAKKKYMPVVYSFVDEYEDDALTTPITLSRTGSDAKNTSYSIMPTRVKKADEGLFVKPDNIVIDNEFYLNVLQPPTDDYLYELLGLGNPTDGADVTVVDIDSEDLPF